MIRSKAIAIFLGTLGLGVYSQLLVFSNLIIVLIPIGSVGLTRYISEFYNEKEYEKVNFLLKRVLQVNLPLALIFGLIAIYFSSTISQILYSTKEYNGLVILFCVSIPLFLFTTLVEIYLRSIRNVSIYVKYVSISSIISLFVFVPMIFFFNVTGAVLTFAATGVLNLIFAYTLFRKNNITPDIRKVKEVDKSIVKKIYGTGLAMIVIYAIQQLSFIAVRSLIADSLSINDLGIYQSVYAISTNYFALFFTVVYTYSLPKFSTFKLNSETNNETNQMLVLLTLIYTPLIIIFFVFREQVIVLLYSKAFSSATELLFFQLIGDFMRMLSWVFALWLIPNLRIKAWAIFDIIFFTNYLTISYCLFHFTNYGIRSISISYMIAYFVHLILNFTYLRKSLKFRISKSGFRKLGISLGAIFVVFMLSEFNVLWGFICVVPIMMLWFFTSVKKYELLKLKEMILNFFGKLKYNQ